MPQLYVLKDTAQNFTSSWVDYGSEICVDGCACLSLWLNLQINDSVDVRIRAMARYVVGGDNFIFPIKTITSSVVNIEDEYFEFTTDEDQKRVISFTFDCVIPYVQFQIQAGTPDPPMPGKIVNSGFIVQ